MQIVIDIPQGLKIDFENENWTALTCAEMKNALMRGIPLPKGHGRLIDEREVYKKFYCRCLAGVANEVLDETSTIIEADKAERGCGI